MTRGELRPVVFSFRFPVLVEPVREPIVDPRHQFTVAAEVGAEVENLSAAVPDPLLDELEGVDVGPSEAVDRLLRVADHEQAPRLDARNPPVGRGVGIRRQQEKDLRLQRIGVLKLVDEQEWMPLRERHAHLGAFTEKSGGPLEQVVERQQALGQSQVLVMRTRPFEQRNHELIAVGPPLRERACECGNDVVPPLFELPDTFRLQFAMCLRSRAWQPQALDNFRTLSLDLLGRPEK